MNLVSAEDLFEDDIYNELYEDIMEECKRFGAIDHILIPRPDLQTGICAPSVGKVFVKFKYIIPAKQARHNLAGRTYNKRTVIASFYPEERFQSKDFLINY